MARTQKIRDAAYQEFQVRGGAPCNAGQDWLDERLPHNQNHTGEPHDGDARTPKKMRVLRPRDGKAAP